MLPAFSRKGWIEKYGVDAVKVEIRNPRVRVEAALAAFVVFHLDGRPLMVFPGADAAAQPQSLISAGEHPPFEDHVLVAALVDMASGRAITKRRIDVILPQVQRLQHMAVRIDNVIGAAHSNLR